MASKQDERRLLAERFFSGENLLQWEEIESGTLSARTAERIGPWVQQLLSGEDPIILPFATADGTVWYAAASGARTFRHLKQDLRAFLGPSYSDFRGQPTHLDTDLPHERALADLFGQHVIRLHVPAEHYDVVRVRLQQYIDLKNQAPERVEVFDRPTGRVLADFEEALRLGDDAAAEACFQELERGGHVDAQNLLYQRIRLYELRRNWLGILDAESRYHLLSAHRRPRQVSQAILRAHYATQLASFETAADAEGAVDRFRNTLRPRIAPLLATRAIYDCAEADALFVMLGISDGNSPAESVGVLADIDEDAPHRPWLVRLAEVTASEARPTTAVVSDTESPLAQARSRYEAGELDEAWRLAQGIEPSTASVDLLLRCAFAIETLSSAKVALGTFAELTTDDQATLRGRGTVSDHLEHLGQLVAPVDAGLTRLREALRLAEKYAADDPDGSLNKSRVALERIVKDSYKRLVGPLPNRSRLHELLGNTQFIARLNGRVLARMKSLQALGDLGSHDRDDDDAPTQSDALRGLDDLRELCAWYETLQARGPSTAGERESATPEATPSNGDFGLDARGNPESVGDAAGTPSPSTAPAAQGEAESLPLAVAASPAIPENWVEWASAVAANPNWMEAALVAEQGAFEWSPSEFGTAAGAAALADSLAALDGVGCARVCESLPFLLSSISRCEPLPRTLASTLETLTMVHLLDEAPGRLFFATLADLVDLNLRAGMSTDGYRALLTECVNATQSKGAPTSIDGLLEVLNVLLLNPSPAPGMRTALAGAVANLCVRIRNRVEETQLLLIRPLLSEADCNIPTALLPPEEETPGAPSNPFFALEGMKVALYSLNENVLNRVSRLLQASVDGLKVEIFHDKVGGSPALRAAARGADVFVIATAAAKHAATIFIEDERGDLGITLKPAGQGSASMIRAIREYAIGLGTSAAA